MSSPEQAIFQSTGKNHFSWMSHVFPVLTGLMFFIDTFFPERHELWTWIMLGFGLCATLVYVLWGLLDMKGRMIQWFVLAIVGIILVQCILTFM